MKSWQRELKNVALIVVAIFSAALLTAVFGGFFLGTGIGLAIRGGVSGTEQEILMCVVTRLEIGKIKSIALEHDPGAFIMFHPLSDVSGGVQRKRLGV